MMHLFARMQSVVSSDLSAHRVGFRAAFRRFRRCVDQRNAAANHGMHHEKKFEKHLFELWVSPELIGDLQKPGLRQVDFCEQLFAVTKRAHALTLMRPLANSTARGLSRRTHLGGKLTLFIRTRQRCSGEDDAYLRARLPASSAF